MANLTSQPDSAQPTEQRPFQGVGPVSLDAILVLVLVLVRARVDTLANIVVPRNEIFVRQVPFFGGLMSDDAFDLLVDWQADPLSQLIIAVTMGLTALYLIVDVITGGQNGRRLAGRFRVFDAKLVLIVAIGIVSVVGNTAMLIALRLLTTPSQFAHDGGVLMSDLALQWFTEGKNAYQQDFHNTIVSAAYPNGPGLSHYPYLPFAFLAGWPLYQLSTGLWGWYDHRLVYIAAYGVVLAVGWRLSGSFTARLGLLAVLALNPLMANEMIYGMNDILLVAIMAAGAFQLRAGRWLLAGAVFGLAIATKATAWPLAPFLLVFVWQRAGATRLAATRKLGVGLALSSLLFIGPFLAWDAAAMYEDTVLYNGGSPVRDGLPIKGWGASAFVVALGLVNDLMDPFPFTLPIVAVAGPLGLALLWRIWKEPSIGGVFASAAVLLFAVAYLSRTMNPNYLGFCLSLLAIALFIDEPARVSLSGSDPDRRPRAAMFEESPSS